MTAEPVLVALVVIAGVGIGCQWLAWRLRIPSILLLLVAGFAVGNFTHLIRPDDMFGEVLFPAVSLAVSLILFEGGLSLRYDELRQVGSTLLNLLTAGAAVTFAISGVAAWLILDLPPGVAALLSAILVVTGPTVITPLLRHVRPTGRVGSILKWEGIAIDPLGAILTVLLLETVVAGRFGRATTVETLRGVALTLVVGAGFGAAAGGVLSALLRRFWIPDFLQNPVAIALVFAAFAGSNAVQAESGLLAAPVIGIVVANGAKASAKHIAAFQEDIRVLLLAALFIILGARTEASVIGDLGIASILFLAVLILIARPAAAYLSTLGSPLNWRERTFLAAVAPRGVVAAAVSSAVAIALTEAGIAGERIVAEVFFVIVGTVTVYGLAARPIARALGIVQKDPKGILIVGAYQWIREIAATLHAQGQSVALVDTNADNVRAARMAGLNAINSDATAPHALDEVHLDGIGRLLAMTSNDEFNALSAMNFSEVLGRAGVYRIHPDAGGRTPKRALLEHGHGRLLFDSEATFTNLTLRFAQGAEVRATKLSAVFTAEDAAAQHPNATPLFAISSAGNVSIFSDDHTPSLGPGATIVSVVGPNPGD